MRVFALFLLKRFIQCVDNTYRICYYRIKEREYKEVRIMTINWNKEVNGLWFSDYGEYKIMKQGNIYKLYKEGFDTGFTAKTAKELKMFVQEQVN